MGRRCGLKPTWGLVPYTGIFPIELTLDHVGPMARTVADCALMLDAIAGVDGLDPRQIDVSVQDYAAGLEVGAEGLRVGVLADGFGIPDASEADVTPSAPPRTCWRGGARVEEVSVPMHRDGPAIWNAIATEGATDLMVRGDGFGTNHKGHYSTDLVDFYGRARRARGMDYSVTVKLTVLLGAYLSEDYNHHYYAKAQNLGRRLAREYAAALERFDVLLLPTTAMKARPFPAERTIPEVLAAALGNLHNTSPFDVTGNPAPSVPCGMSDGLPIGMMLVGRHFDDATVLRAGHAYQASAGPLEQVREEVSLLDGVVAGVVGVWTGLVEQLRPGIARLAALPIRTPAFTAYMVFISSAPEKPNGFSGGEFREVDRHPCPVERRRVGDEHLAGPRPRPRAPTPESRVIAVTGSSPPLAGVPARSRPADRRGLLVERIADRLQLGVEGLLGGRAGELALAVVAPGHRRAQRRQRVDESGIGCWPRRRPRCRRRGR